MANIPLKMLASVFQKRYLQTKASNFIELKKNFIKQSPKPATKSKVEKAEPTLLPSSLGENGKSVVTLLKSLHFSDTQIAKVIERFPGILNCRVATNLKPKLKYLYENGFEGLSLSELILSNPLILRRSLNAHLIPSLNFLKTQFLKGNEEALHTVLKRASWLLTIGLEKSLMPNIKLLEKEGMPMSSILRLFTSQPRCLICSPDRVVYALEMVKRFGIKPDDTMFVHAIRVFLSMSESNMKRKVEVFKSLGWSDEDIVSTVVRQPLCLTCSEEKLKRSMEFFVKTMKFEPEMIIASPKLVMYSLEKRVKPRCNVFLVLQEKKLMSKRMPSSIVNISEEDFIRKYIMNHLMHVPYLLDVYHGNRKMDAAAVQK